MWDPPWDPSRMSEEARLSLEHVLGASEDVRQPKPQPRKPRRALPPLMPLTDAAAERLRALYASGQRGHAAAHQREHEGLLGPVLHMDWVAEAGPGDEVVVDQGLTVLVDRKASLFLIGTEMDYEVESLTQRVHLQQSEREGPLRLRRELPRLIV